MSRLELIHEDIITVQYLAYHVLERVRVLHGHYGFGLARSLHVHREGEQRVLRSVTRFHLALVCRICKRMFFYWELEMKGVKR
jgi:hypothetical protein